MKIFLSWSGSTSKALAMLLKDWLPSVIQTLEPWMSSEDIEKGEKWFQSISESLVRSEGVGIFCLTRDNLGAQWLAYEAGALASQDRGRVATLLFNVGTAEVKPPLGLFQSTSSTDKDDLFKLLLTLNGRTDKPLAEERLKKSFETYWPDFERGVQAIGQAGAVAAPKASDTPQLLEEILKVVRRIERDSVPVRTGAVTGPNLAEHWSAASVARGGLPPQSFGPGLGSVGATIGNAVIGRTTIGGGLGSFSSNKDGSTG